MAQRIYSITCPPDVWTQLFAETDAMVNVRLIGGKGGLAMESSQPTGLNSGNFMPMVAGDQFVNGANDNKGWFKPSYEPNETKIDVAVIVVK